MPKNPDIKKVLVIGSGPIVIGQAAEFDYAGTQACRSLKEEGIEVVLLNSNPATIMTDKDIADRVYIEPLTVEVVEQLILKEKPDSVLPTLGGQAGLNLAMELDESRILRGAQCTTDRNHFRDHQKGGGPSGIQRDHGENRRAGAASLVVENVEDGMAFPRRSVTRLCFVRHIPWAEAAAESPTTGRTGGDPGKRSSSFPCRTGSGRALHRRLERDRVRGNA